MVVEDGTGINIVSVETTVNAIRSKELSSVVVRDGAGANEHAVQRCQGSLGEVRAYISL